jgi:predicted TIM-barrel enzyme
MISRPLIFGMVHLRALPGTPKSSLKVQEICDKALEEAFLLFNKNVDGIIIENMHDVPYQRPDQSKVTVRYK